MEKVANTGVDAGSRREKTRIRWGVGLLACAAWHAGWAQDAGAPAPEQMLAQAGPGQLPLRLQVDSSTLPRFEAQDSGFQAPRIDLSLVSGDARRTNLAPVLGVSNVDGQFPGTGLSSPRTDVDLGLRFSHRFRNEARIDVTAWRRMTGPDDAYSMIQAREQPVYGARVEMKIAPAKFRFGLDRGLLGFQLESGARISIKRKDGRPMVYYRTSF